MGKTGLISHVFEKFRREKSYDTLYLDIYHTENLGGFINQFATALLRMKKPFGRRVQDMVSGLRYLRPMITADPFTGAPSVTFQIAAENEALRTLEELFAILQERAKTKPVVVAIDEFQQITSYPEKNTEALLRGLILNLSGVHFIFSGSNKSMLARMFSDASRPFYQSTELVFIQEIDPDSYLSFISRQFMKHGRPADEAVIGDLLTWTRRHTWYVQYACNNLFEKGVAVNMDLLRSVQQEILENFSPFYLEYRSLLTHQQWQLMKALARENGVLSVTSGQFIRRHNLTNASTVARGISSLLEKEMIFQQDDAYYVYDVFLSRWLENL
jgi:hypothetical protein